MSRKERLDVSFINQEEVHLSVFKKGTSLSKDS